ncbi:g3897 [Coccomyxa elongata]
MADMEAQGPSMDIIKELSISDTDSDYAEDMRFDKLEVPATDPREPAAERFEGVLAACKAMKLQPGQSILAFAKQMIEEHTLDDTFYVIDLGLLARLHAHFVAAMPRVTPFYAVKCMPDRAMMATLAGLGTGFDCASPAEIDAVLSLGVPPERIIYAHPVKSPTQIRYAAARSVALTTADSPGEMAKLARWHPTAKVLLRIRADDASALCCLGSKYGADPGPAATAALSAAAALGVNIVGVSFHVGSASRNPQAFEVAIRLARGIFDMGASLGLRSMHILDIGGGFTAQVDAACDSVMGIGGVPSVVNAALATHFPLGCGYDIIAEPGRYFAEAVGTLLCTVNGKREQQTAHGRRTDYWLSDGLYGSFNGILYDHLEPCPIALPISSIPKSYEAAEIGAVASLFGPTCDGADVICRDVSNLPDLDVGDFVAFPKMGAYSWAGACNFNGFEAIWVKFFYVTT